MATPRETKVFLAKFMVCLAVALLSLFVMLRVAPPGSALYKAALAVFFVAFICAVAVFLVYGSWLAKYGRREMRERYLAENASALKPWER